MSHILGAIPENLSPEQLSQEPLLYRINCWRSNFRRSNCRRSKYWRSNCRIFGASVAGAIVGGAIVGGAIIAGANVGGANVGGAIVAGANVSEHLSRSICRIFRSNCRRCICRRSICHGTHIHTQAVKWVCGGFSKGCGAYQWPIPKNIEILHLVYHTHLKDKTKNTWGHTQWRGQEKKKGGGNSEARFINMITFFKKNRR